MTTTRLLKYVGYIILVIAVIFIILFIKASNDGFGFSPGSGIGSLADIDSTKYQDTFYRRYADTFLKDFPQYKKPDSIYGGNQASTYSFMNLTPFYFSRIPKEIYYVQWEGTGFISVRFGYSLDKQEEVFENWKSKAYIGDKEKQRIKNRFRHEILDKVDSIISVSKDKDSAILKSPF